jgi:hypothetical protein
LRRDSFLSPALVQDAQDIRVGVQPWQDLSGRLAVVQSPIYLGANLRRQTGDLAFARRFHFTI